MRLFTQFIITIVFIALATSASAIPFRPSSSQFIMGTGATEDLFLTGDIGSGAGNPFIKLDSASGKWQFQNAGASVKNFGSGSGSGGSGGINILINASMEDGIEGWTTSGGSLSSQLYVNPSEGDEKYLRFIATTSGQYVEQTFLSFPDKMGTGCMADFWYIQGDSAFTYSIVESGETGTVTDLTEWQKAPTLTAKCPTAGTPLTLRITSTGAGTIDFDTAYLGSNKNISDIEAVEEQMSAFTYVAKAADSTIQFSSGLTGVTEISGDIFTESSNGSTGTLITFSKPADVTLTARMGNSSVQGFWIQLNGNNLTAETTAQSSPVDTGSASVRVLVNSGDVLRVWGSSSTFNQGSMVVTATSRSTKESVFTPEQANFYINVNIGGSSNTVVSAGATPKAVESSSLDMIINEGSAKIPCSGTNVSSGLTCASGSETIGLVFNAPVSGKYKACFSYQTFQGTSGLFTARLGLTDASDSTLLVTGNSLAGTSGSESNSHRLCDTFSVSSGEHAIRLFTAAATSSTTFYTDRLSSSFQRDVNITVELVENNVARPVIQDMVSTRGNRWEVQSCQFTGISSPIPQSDCASWVDVIQNEAVGRTSFQFKAGFDSSKARCWCNEDRAPSSYAGSNSFCQARLNTATNVMYTDLVDTTTNVDANATLFCRFLKD